MTAPLDDRSRQRLRDRLGTGGNVDQFAAAIVAHLSGPPACVGSARDLTNEVIEAIEAVLGGSTEAAADILASRPVLLASFFQNADLLEPHSREAALIGRMVMKAVAGAWEER